MSEKFWQIKKLDALNQDEWESLCDGCGRCCLHKLEDEDTGDVYYTDIACKLLDLQQCRCRHYAQRQRFVDDCLVLTPGDIEQLHWLPGTCAYRLIAEGKPLYDWHPLLSGNSESVHQAGISVRGRAKAESDVPCSEIEQHIIHWVQ